MQMRMQAEGLFPRVQYRDDSDIGRSGATPPTIRSAVRPSFPQ